MMLEKLFKLKAHNTTVRTEVIAGITTFLAMAYILFVNPSILGATGMDKGAVFVATCLAAAIGCVLMGLIANYPIALAPGMGLNAFFTYTVVLHMGYTWQIALGAVFLSAVIFFALSIFKIREWIIASIPLPLRAGIGTREAGRPSAGTRVPSSAASSSAASSAAASSVDSSRSTSDSLTSSASQIAARSSEDGSFWPRSTSER